MSDITGMKFNNNDMGLLYHKTRNLCDDLNRANCTINMISHELNLHCAIDMRVCIPSILPVGFAFVHLSVLEHDV